MQAAVTERAHRRGRCSHRSSPASHRAGEITTSFSSMNRDVGQVDNQLSPCVTWRMRCWCTPIAGCFAREVRGATCRRFRSPWSSAWRGRSTLALAAGPDRPIGFCPNWTPSGATSCCHACSRLWPARHLRSAQLPRGRRPDQLWRQYSRTIPLSGALALAGALMAYQRDLARLLARRAFYVGAGCEIDTLLPKSWLDLRPIDAAW